MKKIITFATLLIALGMASCETSEDISNRLDHQVPDCKTLILTSKGQNKVIDDNLVTKLLWGVVPQTNMETITLPTITVLKGDTINISVIISDNVALKTVDLAYTNWLFDKYINFTNPEGDIPKTPQSFTFTAQVIVPSNAVTTPWLENYYFNDGSTMKVTQSYHKFTLTVVDINMNQRIIPVFIKVN